MKKSFSFLMLGALTLGLAACGPKGDSSTSSGSSAKKGDYDLLVWEDKDKSNGISDAVKEFEKENKVKVKVMEKEYGGQLKDLRLDGPAGTGPDVITIPGDQIGTGVTEGLIKELKVEESTQKMYTQAAMQSQIVNGKVYGLPKAVETQILFYNKKLLSKDKLPKNTDEWLSYSKSVLGKDSYGLLALWDQIYYAQGVMTPFGGYLFGKDASGKYDAKDLGINSEGSVKGAEYIQEFYKSGVFPTGIIGEQGINVLDTLFTEGKAAAVISGPWNVEPYKKAGIDYGVVELPLLPNGKHMGSFIGVKSYNVSSYTKKAELAEKFVTFISNEENSKARYEKTKEVPAISKLAEDDSVKSSEVSVAIAEQSKHAELTPGITAMNSVWDPANAALQTIATKKASPKDALKQAEQQIKDAIKATEKK